MANIRRRSLDWIGDCDVTTEWYNKEDVRLDDETDSEATDNESNEEALFVKKSDSVRVKCAKALIQDSLLGRSFLFTPRQVDLYLRYRSGPSRIICISVTVLNFLLSFMFTKQHLDESDWKGLAVPWFTIELLVSLFFLAEAYVRYRFMGSVDRFKKDTGSVVLLVSAVIQLLDVTIFHLPNPATLKSLVAMPALRLYTRPLLLTLRYRPLLNAVQGIAVAAKALVPVVLFLFCYVSLFGLFGLISYRESFHNLPNSVYQFYQALTTNAFPEILLSTYIKPYDLNSSIEFVGSQSVGWNITQLINITRNDVSFKPQWETVSSRLPPVLFALFIVTGPFFLMSVAFAVVYDSKAALQSQVILGYHHRQKLFKQAFKKLTYNSMREHRSDSVQRISRPTIPQTELNDITQSEGSDSDVCVAVSGVGELDSSSSNVFNTVNSHPLSPVRSTPNIVGVTRTVFHQLFSELQPCDNATQQSILRWKKIEIIFHALDVGKRGVLTEENFCQLFELLRVNISVVAVRDISRDNTLQKILRSKQFTWYSNSMIVFCVLFASFHYQSSSPDDVAKWPIFLALELLLGIIVDVEVLLKAFTLKQDFWKVKWNKFDFATTLFNIVVYIIFILLWGIYGLHDAAVLSLEGHFSHSANNTPDLINVMLLCRIVKTLRVLSTYRPFRLILKTTTHLLPVFTSYVVLLGCVSYFFAVVGMQTIGGAVPAPPSSYALNNYFALRFDTVLSGMVTALMLTVQNDMFQIIDGFRQACGNGVLVFFVSFWIISVLLTLNVVLAFIVELFQSQWAAKSVLEKHPVISRVLSVNNLKTDDLHFNELSLPPSPEGYKHVWEVKGGTRQHKVQLALEWVFIHRKKLKAQRREAE